MKDLWLVEIQRGVGSTWQVFYTEEDMMEFLRTHALQETIGSVL